MRIDDNSFFTSYERCPLIFKNIVKQNLIIIFLRTTPGGALVVWCWPTRANATRTVPHFRHNGPMVSLPLHPRLGQNLNYLLLNPPPHIGPTLAPEAILFESPCSAHSETKIAQIICQGRDFDQLFYYS